MSPEKFQSPEKQLLNLIEKPQSNPGKRAHVLPQRRKGVRFKLRLPRLSIRTGNMLLLGSILILSAYLASSVFSSLGSIEEKLRQQTQVKAFGSSAGEEDPFSMKELGVYLAQIADRDIFIMGGRKRVVDDQEGPVVPSSSLMEATKDLRLVGISWSDDPDVMIEDIARHVTFFLKQNDTMESGVVVSEIRKESVILSLNGEQVELK